MDFNPAREYSVWDGRFQPFHCGHLQVIHAILELRQAPLVVMIIQSSLALHTSGFSAEVDNHHQPSRNPLSLWERYVMLSLALAQANLLNQVTVLGIPRPDLYWPIARQFYPPNRVICLTNKDNYERAKAKFWTSLGERPVTTPVHGAEGLSATELKRRIKADHAWEELLAPGTLEYFRQIRGPERFACAEEK